MVYVQTDAPINPETAGGPLVNVDGEMLASTPLFLTESGWKPGLGLRNTELCRERCVPAIPEIRPFTPQRGRNERSNDLSESGRRLGLPRNFGLVVSDVLPGGPADLAGLRVQDVILALNDKRVDSLPSLPLIFPRTREVTNKLRVLRGSRNCYWMFRSWNSHEVGSPGRFGQPCQ